MRHILFKSDRDACCCALDENIIGPWKTVDCLANAFLRIEVCESVWDDMKIASREFALNDISYFIMRNRFTTEDFDRCYGHRFDACPVPNERNEK